MHLLCLPPTSLPCWWLWSAVLLSRSSEKVFSSSHLSWKHIDGHFCHLMFLFELCLVQTNEIKNPRPIKKYLVQTQRQKWHLPILHSALGPCCWKVEYKRFFLSLWFLPIMWLWINNSLHVPMSHCYVLIKKNIYLFTIEFVTFNQVPCC